MGYPTYGLGHSTETALRKLIEISDWIDFPNRHLDTDTQLAYRTSVKLAEETGEVGAALIGMTGQNPRKGVTHTIEDVKAELLDVAITALGAYEHATGNAGTVFSDLFEKINTVHDRMS